MARNGNTLGIALGSRVFQIAEVSGSGNRFSVAASAEFLLAEGDSLQKPEALGKKLAQFLKQNKFSATSVVFGLPAQWLMLKEKTVPPAAPEVLASLLQIQAERDFSLEPGALALDYVPGIAGSDGLGVVLAATLRERVEQVRQLATSAGLRIHALTSTSLALAAAADSSALLYISSNGVEWASRAVNGLPRVRHIRSGSIAERAAILALAGELRRGMAIEHQSTAGEPVTFADDVGLPQEKLDELGSEAEMTLQKLARLGSYTVEGFLDSQSAGAIVLSLLRQNAALAPFDFLNSRLAIKPKSKLSPRIVWSSVAALFGAVLFGYLLLSWHQSAADVEELRQTRANMKENVDSAKSFIAQVNATSTWYEKRPNYLECLREVTLCFPEEGKVWTTSVSLREDMRGMLSGRATDEKHVLDVLDKMKSGGSFAEVKMLQMRSAGTKSSEFTFGISFVFLGVKQTTGSSGEVPAN